MRMKGLFVGKYPNKVCEYRNVFFRNLIFAMSNNGVDSTVISPVPVTKYLDRTKEIPHRTTNMTTHGSVIDVYYPRYISVSSKKIGRYNTEKISEYLFKNSVLKIAKQLDKPFDFVYGHFFLYGGLTAVAVGRVLQIPSFIAYGECDFESQIGNTYGIPKQSEIDGLAGIISVSSKNTKELKDLGFVNDAPIITVPNSADVSLFYPMDKSLCRRELRIPEDKFVVGFVGYFIERKGDKRLLEAVNQLDDVYVAFAGCGDNPPTGERVVFCNELAHEKVAVLLNAVDVFVLPTLSEGSCNAIVEAMACGSAIISSDLPFNDDALDEENSIRINPSSVDEIREAIKKLRDNPQERARLSYNALERSKDFNIGNRAERIIKFIEDTTIQSQSTDAKASASTF